MDPSVIESVRVQLAGLYHFNILLLIPVVLIVILSIRKVPAILAILISGFAGLACGSGTESLSDRRAGGCV